MKENSNAVRITNSIRNLLAAGLGQLIIAILSFVERKTFTVFLSQDYLGINGLYTSILTVLSIAELGIGTTIVFSLYKPLAENDTESVAAIMQLFKKIYLVIGSIILLAGLVCIPFLDKIIKSDLNLFELRAYFILFLLNSVSSYFFSYKTCLIEADQKKYIISLGNVIAQIIQYVLQMIVLAIWRNYYLYLTIVIVVNLIKYIYLSHRADCLYPILKEKKIYRLNSDIKSRIVKNIKAMFCHKIGGVVVGSTDTILISSMVSLAKMGIYSNYQMISSGLNYGLNMIFSSMTASIGNLCAVEDNDTIYKSFKQMNLATFIVYGICTSFLFVTFEPLIKLLFGESYMIGQLAVTFICVNLYISGMRVSVLTYRDVLGLFWEERYKPLAEALINLVASILLGKHFGLVGILLGTTISSVTTCCWVEPYILFKYGLKKPLLPYFIVYLSEAILLVITTIISFYISTKFSFDSNLLSLIVKAIIGFLIPSTIFVLVFHKNESFKNIVILVKNLVRK